jgi:antitoxin component YwqK of YwqJK toxin-antitoxin module
VRIIALTLCLVCSFGLLFRCSVQKRQNADDGKDSIQLDLVKQYVEPETPRVNTIRDTVVTECLQKDCSEGIKRFYIKGNLNGESYFRDNERFLVNKTYYENNGPLAHVDTLINRTLVGASVIYHPNGQLQRIMRRDRNGVEIGPYQSYYETGKPKLTVEYVDGKRHGKMIEYYENGKVMQQGEFRHDKRHGVWRVNDINGNLKEEKKYDNGVEVK